MAVGNFRVKPAPFNSKYHHRGNFLDGCSPLNIGFLKLKQKKVKNNELERN
tara:strand:- start:131 stop:283 length:153 start_codon:yes stop_codon:yes gene_type:complete